MTTYAYTITFNDSEIIMLEAALKNMVAHCEEKLKEGAGAPYWAHKHFAEEVLRKMHRNIRQTSGNNF